MKKIITLIIPLVIFSFSGCELLDQLINITNTNQNIGIIFKEPASGSTVESSIGVVAEATSLQGQITYAELYIIDTSNNNEVYVRKDNTAPYEWGTASTESDPALTNLVGGRSYKLKVDAFDDKGNQGSKTITVTVSESTGTMPASDPPWTINYQKEIMAKLTGEEDISPGQTISQRYTDNQREIASNYLKDLWQSTGLTAKKHSYSGGANVYATLPATNGSNEWIVLCAHYDTVSRAPGADDNASGVVLISAVARFATTIPSRTRNLMVVALDEEEVGFVGSYKFVNLLKDYDVHSIHNFDMVSWTNGNNRTVRLHKATTAIYNLYKDAADYLNIPIIKSNGGGSDHTVFIKYGYKASAITEDDFSPYYHSSQDSYDKVKFEYLESNTILINELMLEMIGD